MADAPAPRRPRVLVPLALLALAGAAAGAWWAAQGGTPAAPPSRSTPAGLEREVRRICADFAPRDHAHPQVLNALAAHLAEELGAAGGVVSEQRVLGGRFRNVIARFGPEAGPRIVVGAHYDTCGDQPGADDNASGVAGLLGLAELLGRSPPALRVDLVAYPLEEPPHFRTEHMGSAVHARSLAAAGVEVRAMIAIEMIGFFSDEPGSQRYPAPALEALFPDRGNFIGLVGRLQDAELVGRVERAMRAADPLPVVAATLPAAVPGVDFSDHLNYWEQGFPALMVTDTAFMRNERYHTAEDTPDTLDYARMARVVTQLHAAVQALAAAGP